LVISQIALSLALLTAGGLFFFGAVRARTADPGFSLEGGVVAATDTGLAGYDNARARTTMIRVVNTLRALNGVESASIASSVPFGESSEDRPFQRAGSPPEAPAINAMYRVIGADYFRTLGVPVLRGREFTSAEEGTTETLRVAIVDSELAKRLWPGEDPIGRQVQWARRRDAQSEARIYEVVGVVGSMKRSLFDLEPLPHVYVPYGGPASPAMTVHVRGKAKGPEADAALLASVGEAIRSVDSALPLVSLKTLVEHRDTGFEVWFVRLAAEVFAVFGIVALLVAMVGVYGVRAIMVGRRTREFGIRIAIGATPGDVLRLVMTEGARLIVVGLGAGLLLSAGVSRMLAGWTYGVRTFEPAVFITASLLLVTAMLAACYLPARRATAIRPATALRNE
jgi:putative ABC transport system permease protein